MSPLPYLHNKFLLLPSRYLLLQPGSSFHYPLLGLFHLATKCIGCPVIPQGHIYTKTLFVVDLKFKFNQMSCIFFFAKSRNPVNEPSLCCLCSLCSQQLLVLIELGWFQFGGDQLPYSSCEPSPLRKHPSSSVEACQEWLDYRFEPRHPATNSFRMKN